MIKKSQDENVISIRLKEGKQTSLTVILGPHLEIKAGNAIKQFIVFPQVHF